MTRLTLPGPFVTQDMGGGLWLLDAGGASGGVPAGASAGVRVYLKLRGHGATLKGRGILKLELHWRPDGVLATVTGRDGPLPFDASSALVHQSRTDVYDGLPLAGFDAKAKRFWKRIFLLMRIPGGRLLLRSIARSRR